LEIQVLENPVRMVEDPDAISYYGFIAGRSALLKVVLQKHDDSVIETAHFDTTATRRFRRGIL
jgi:hypothetical protein